MATNESADSIRLTVHAVLPDPNTDTQIVLLKDAERGEILPIWVGPAEGNAIRLALEGIAAPRPMSHDLIKSLTEHLGIGISRVTITDVKANTYYAQIHIEVQGTDRTIDSRPSDAIALALRTNCPIYAASEVLKQRGGGSLDAWLEKLESKQLGKHEV
jgi:bifunctional DNase/RNase